MTAAQNFPRAGFREQKYHSNVVRPAIILACMRASRCPNGSGKAGSIPMIHGAGSNGTAVTTWGADFPKKIGGKYDAGKPYAAMSSRFVGTAILETTTAGADKDKLCCTGLMTAEKFELESPRAECCNCHSN